MPFEIYQPTRTTCLMGQVSINSTGTITFNAIDLQTRGIHDRITILVDRSTQRLGFRKPRSSDPTRPLHYNKSKNAANLNVTGALKLLGLLPAQIKGTHKVEVIEDLLTICFFMGKGRKVG